MAAFHYVDPTFGSVFYATANGDVMTSAATADWMIGHAGRDTFAFGKGSGADIVLGFEQGVDVIQIAGSIRQTSLVDTADGTMVSHGGFGPGPDHVLIYGVHGLALSDFAFV